MFSQWVDDDILLTQLVLGDTSRLFKVIDHGRAHLAAWLPWVDRTHTTEDVRRFVENAAVAYAKEQSLHCAIRVQGRLVGVISLAPVEMEHRRATLGYWLLPSEQGKGVMTKSARAILHHAFVTLALNRVEARVAVGNDRSRAVVERLGFIAEGTLRQTEKLRDGYVDHQVFGLLVEEWRVQRERARLK